jgi:hypothetical protein
LVVFVSVYTFKNESEISPKANATINIIKRLRTYSGSRGGEAKYDGFRLDKSGTLKSGDFFRVKTSLDQNVYAYVIFRDSADKISGIKVGYVTAGEEFFLPDINNWYQLDSNTGEETIYVVATKEELQDFDTKFEKLRKVGVGNINQIFPEAAIRSFSFNHE